MQPTKSGGGLDYFEPFPTAYGHKLQVYESSSVEPSLWLRVDAGLGSANGDTGEQCVLMRLTEAIHLRDQLNHLIENHYGLE